MSEDLVPILEAIRLTAASYRERYRRMLSDDEPLLVVASSQGPIDLEKIQERINQTDWNLSIEPVDLPQRPGHFEFLVYKPGTWKVEPI